MTSPTYVLRRSSARIGLTGASGIRVRQHHRCRLSERYRPLSRSRTPSRRERTRTETPPSAHPPGLWYVLWIGCNREKVAAPSAVSHGRHGIDEAPGQLSPGGRIETLTGKVPRPDPAPYRLGPRAMQRRRMQAGQVPETPLRGRHDGTLVSSVQCGCRDSSRPLPADRCGPSPPNDCARRPASAAGAASENAANSGEPGWRIQRNAQATLSAIDLAAAATVSSMPPFTVSRLPNCVVRVSGKLTWPNAWLPATPRPKPFVLFVDASATRCSADCRLMALLEPPRRALRDWPLDTGAIHRVGSSANLRVRRRMSYVRPSLPGCARCSEAPCLGVVDLGRSVEIVASGHQNATVTQQGRFL